jgi:hypothetical protein
VHELQGSGLVLWSKLTTVNFEQTDITDGSLADALTAMPLVEVLRLGGCSKIFSLQKSFVAMMTAARRMARTHDAKKKVTVNLSDVASPLQVLKVSNTPITSEGLLGLATTAPLITSLNCQNCLQLTDLSAIHNLRFLENLTLSTTSVFPSRLAVEAQQQQVRNHHPAGASMDMSSLSLLVGVPTLAALDLSANAHLCDVSGLVPSGLCVTLTSLNVSSTKLSAEGATLALSSLLRLKELRVSRCKSLHNISNAIDASTHLSKTLRLLDAAQSGLTSDGSASIRQLTRLTSLDLSGCTDINATSLHGIVSSCSNLTSLSLYGCPGVTDDVVTALSTSICALETLNLGKCIHMTSFDAALVGAREGAGMIGAAFNSTLRRLNLTGLPDLNPPAQLSVIPFSAKHEDSRIGLSGFDVSFPLLEELDLRGCRQLAESQWAEDTALGRRVAKFHI